VGQANFLSLGRLMLSLIMALVASKIPSGCFSQVAALPVAFGSDAVCRVLLLTSRETKRWVIPKGWPMKGRKPWEAAAQEALEEAGLIGHVSKKPLGQYTYFKRRTAHFDLCQVDVFLLMIKKQLKKWREQGQRRAEWFTFEEAAALVDEVGLAAILRSLAEKPPAEITQMRA
jgi:8-oxo-dGTP pyrophosphatase MutT (NUDIX family)